MSKKVSNRTISSVVRETLLQRPFLLSAIKLGIINYSALARLLKRDIKANTEAIKAAILRERRRIANMEAFKEENVLSLLRKT